MRLLASRSPQGGLLAALLLLSSVASAQSNLCDPLLPTPQDDEYAYRLRWRLNRC
jgi:hypothetical protein